MRLVRSIRRFLDRWRPFYWLRTHTVDRYHLVDMRCPRNGYRWGWLDRSEGMLFAAFAILVDFVDREYPGYVDWEHSDEMRAQRDEVMALYRWWTVERKSERDADDGTTDVVDDKDDEMLLRLVKVRGILWT